MEYTKSFIKMLSLDNPRIIAVQIIMCLIGVLISLLLIKLFFNLKYDINESSSGIAVGLYVLVNFNIVSAAAICLVCSTVILEAYLIVGITNGVFKSLYGIVKGIIYFLF